MFSMPNQSSRLGRYAVLAVSAALLLGAGTVKADFTFNFSGLSDNASNASVQTYMQGVVGGAGTITVTGAVASTSYNGDGRVVGPGSGATSATLATWNLQTTAFLASVRPFIMNNQGESSNGGDPHSDHIKLAFSGGLHVSGISFDFEVFPDAGALPPNPAPDFGLVTNLGTVFTQLGIAPGTASSYSASWTHSPFHGSSVSETAPQFLGHYSNSNLGAGITDISFYDWPAHVGVTNVTFMTPGIVTPEPATWILLACGIMSAPFFRRFGGPRPA